MSVSLPEYSGRLRHCFPIIFAMALTGQGPTKIARLLIAMDLAPTRLGASDREHLHSTEQIVNGLLGRWRRPHKQHARIAPPRALRFDHAAGGSIEDDVLEALGPYLHDDLSLESRHSAARAAIEAMRKWGRP
jgi:hypothetical protein